MDAINSNVLQDIGLGPASNPEGSRKNNAEDLGVSDFLTLMLTQIKNQDPFDPMQNGDFIAQLAQFGTVSGIDKLQTSFSSFSESMFSNQALEAASLIGRNVQVGTDQGVYIADSSLTGAIELPEDSIGVTVRVLDKNGVQVDSMDVGDQEAGTLDFYWDGTTSDGSQAPTGVYQVVAEALVDGEATGLDTFLDIPVTSVSFNGDGGGIELELLNGETVGFSDIREIR